MRRTASSAESNPSDSFWHASIQADLNRWERLGDFAVQFIGDLVSTQPGIRFMEDREPRPINAERHTRNAKPQYARGMMRSRIAIDVDI
jgi:hypothetical protein